MIVRAEFTTEPFIGEGTPPDHAVAARDCLREAGFEPEFGPFGTAASGERKALLPTLASALNAALDAGANRITLQVSVDEGAE